MTDSEVLETCIQRAIDGGWLGTQECTHLQWLEAIKEDSKQKWFEKDIYYMVIYNHEFAKSLWGDEFKYFVARDGRGTAVGEIEYVTYKHHLQQMVISEDPIDYLRKWLDSRLAEQ